MSYDRGQANRMLKVEGQPRKVVAADRAANVRELDGAFEAMLQFDLKRADSCTDGGGWNGPGR